MQKSFDTRTANFKATGFSGATFQKLAARVSAANGGARAIAFGTSIG